MSRVEFFFDCSSPWTYLAFHNIQPIVRECGAEIVWRPILVGGVFNAVNDRVYRDRENPLPVKAAYMDKDLADWARLAGLAIRWRPTIFPINSVRAMRGCILAGREGKPVEHARLVFEAYWRDDRDITQDAVLSEIATACGLDPDRYLAAIRSDEIKSALRGNTDELIARGGFGSPTMFVDGVDMYFGNDRLPLVRAALTRGL
jgi:2-hydroxychromene-2-carboxylate isomerase